ncbi:MAG TPA: hypothetical protein VET88_13850 [Gammaproteobacteria bacterium]|nr:hypothetical protein [Gammaproteobacteria bacterium]
MKALAGYIVSGRWQAALVTAASGLLAVLLLPLSCLGAASIALVTLYVGVLPGLQVLLLATASVILMYLLAGVQTLVAIVIVLVLWIPCWLAATILQQTRDLGAALKAATLFGATLLLLVYAAIPDPAAAWLDVLKVLLTMVEEAGLRLEGLNDEQLLQEFAALMTGVALSWLVLAIAASLLLARWWQSVLVRPGAFRDEFCDLRLGNLAGVMTLGMLLVARLSQGTVSEITAQLAMIMLVPYMLTGLAVVHSLVKQAGRGYGWLAAVYLLLAFVPQTTLLLAAGGLLDTWVDLRRRLGRKDRSP